jgi:hypothetical protein
MLRWMSVASQVEENLYIQSLLLPKRVAHTTFVFP